MNDLATTDEYAVVRISEHCSVSVDVISRFKLVSFNLIYKHTHLLLFFSSRLSLSPLPSQKAFFLSPSLLEVAVCRADSDVSGGDCDWAIKPELLNLTRHGKFLTALTVK